MMSDNLKTVKKHLISTLILIAYSVMLIEVMVFKDLPTIRIGPLMFNFGGTQEGPANLLPFKTILPYLLGEKGFIIAVINLVGNIVLLVPIGFLVPFIFRNMTWKKSLALAVAAGFTIEGMQAILHVGIFDIDDVILNGLGVMVGYWAFAILAKWMRSGKYKTIIITSIILIAAPVAVLYAVHPKGRRPATSVPGAENRQPGSTTRLDTAKPGIPQGVDPCNGTDGTGQIISVGINTITIKRRDGTSEIIKLTDKTTMRNSAGPISKSDLKRGDRVTVVVMSQHTATVVLVCNAPSSKSVK
jgi:glycopeptide antibiotics resistance protein